MHTVLLSGGRALALATHACAWHGSLTPQSASVLQASWLFTGAGSRHSKIGDVEGAGSVVEGVPVAGGGLTGVSGDVAGADADPAGLPAVALPDGGVAGGGQQAANSTTPAPIDAGTDDSHEPFRASMIDLGSRGGGAARRPGAPS